jgi:hypothetical protein
VAYILYKNTTRLVLVERRWDIEYIKWFPAKSDTHLKGTISVLVKGVIEGNRASVCGSVWKGINPYLNINAFSVTVKLGRHSEVIGVTDGTHSTGFPAYQGVREDQCDHCFYRRRLDESSYRQELFLSAS